jgi:hypothetical protein
MNGDEFERSESGSPIYRHPARERGWTAPQHGGQYLNEVTAHVEKHIGKIDTVFHELASDLIHLDVLHVPPTEEHPHHVLVTSGVSDEPMNVPAGAEQFRRAELLMALPEKWHLTREAFEDEANYWPVRLLKTVGRLPHEHDTWIARGHTVCIGDTASPIANTRFVAVLLTPPYWLSHDFFQLTTNDGETISFYSLVPLYQEELDLKLSRGASELEEELGNAEVGFVLDVNRPNVAKK